jgi:aromatic ring hydroxylase
MKLAWDAIGEQFGSRSLLYEWFFAGNLNNRILYYRTDTNTNCVAILLRIAAARARAARLFKPSERPRP